MKVFCLPDILVRSLVPFFDGIEHKFLEYRRPEAPVSQKSPAVIRSKSALDVPNSGRWKIGSRFDSSARMSNNSGLVVRSGSIFDFTE
jgi:hypothetical protein